MARYTLRAGLHEDNDLSKPILDAQGNETGRYAPRTYRAGEVVESDKDLVAKFGPNHFELEGGGSASDQAELARLRARVAELEAAGGAATPGDVANATENPSSFPGGQVSTGFPAVTPGTPYSPARQRPLTADELPRALGDAAPQQQQQQQPAKGQQPKGPARTPAKSAADREALESMTVAELRQYAEGEEVELRAGMHKDEIVETILKAK